MHIIYIIFTILLEVSIIALFIIIIFTTERIDIIYSKDFTKVFIGVLRGKGTKYAGYIRLQKNVTQLFDLKQKDSKIYSFEIVFTNDHRFKLLDIYNNIVDDNLRELFSLLNDKFNIKVDKNN